MDGDDIGGVLAADIFPMELVGIAIGFNLMVGVLFMSFESALLIVIEGEDLWEVLLDFWLLEDDLLLLPKFSVEFRLSSLLDGFFEESLFSLSRYDGECLGLFSAETP